VSNQRYPHLGGNRRGSTPRKDAWSHCIASMECKIKKKGNIENQTEKQRYNNEKRKGE
jgi:hypothetical protein